MRKAEVCVVFLGKAFVDKHQSKLVRPGGQAWCFQFSVFSVFRPSKGLCHDWFTVIRQTYNLTCRPTHSSGQLWHRGHPSENSLCRPLLKIELSCKRYFKYTDDDDDCIRYSQLQRSESEEIISSVAIAKT